MTLSTNIFLPEIIFFFLNETTQIDLYKAKSNDFYKIHTEDQTGPKRWSEKLSLEKGVWTKIF